MGRYYNQKAKQQPEIKAGDLVILNSKNICTKHPSKKLPLKLYGLFKVLEKPAKLAYKIKILDCWNIHPVFHVLLLEPYRTSIRPAQEQPSMQPEENDGDLQWEVEKIVNSEKISYERRVQGRPRTFKEIWYFIKCKGCSKDENSWEPPEHLENTQELVEDFHRENPKITRLG